MHLTIGEVGLSEIKLVNKDSIENVPMRYRATSNNQENRSAVRPHTMSSASKSPYSSTNSLNLSDSSSSIVVNQRIGNSHVFAAPGRKKRIAPRPPSQCSIPEDPEKLFAENGTLLKKHPDVFHEMGSKHSNLVRRDLHVSSPNLTVNENTGQKSFKFSESMMSSNDTRKRNGNSSNDDINTQNYDTSEGLNIQNENINLNAITNSTFNCNHSRTSSETSDITIRDISLSELQPRKRTTLGKLS